MRIRYERTIDDMLAFVEYTYDNSPGAKRFVSRYRWTYGLLIFLAPLPLLPVIAPAVPFYIRLVLSAVCAAIFAISVPGTLKRNRRERALKLYAPGKNAALYGEQVLEVTETGMIARSDYMETKMAWGAIERVETTPDYTFVYISSVYAYVVPHNHILEGDCQAFLAALALSYKPGESLERSTA